MPSEWTGELIGKMHNHGITRGDVAKEMGVSNAYITMLLHEEKTPKNARDRLETAVAKIIERNGGSKANRKAIEN